MPSKKQSKSITTNSLPYQQINTEQQFSNVRQFDHVNNSIQQEKDETGRKCMFLMFYFYFIAGVVLVMLSYYIPYHLQNMHSMESVKQGDGYENKEKSEIVKQEEIKSKQVISNDRKQKPQQLIINTEKQQQQQKITDIKEQQPIITNNQQPQIKQNIRPLLQLNLTASQLQQVIKQMQHPSHRPEHIRTTKSLKYINQIYFSYSLSQEPMNNLYLQAEFERYDRKYQIGKYGMQLPLCLVMVGRNNKDNYYKLYDSIHRQNYTNYRIVHIDDNSDDGTMQKIQQYLMRKDRQALVSRTILYSQPQNMYALYNRDYAISNFCQNQDIVIDVDADDWLIGNQVFQLVNSLYQKYGQDNKGQQLWLMYLNNIIYYPGCRCPLTNSEGQIEESMLENKEYRTSKIWRTTELRTFKQKLYEKIDKEDFKDRYGNYHIEKSDAFIHFALVELAAPKHMKIIDEFVYFYESSFAAPSLLRSFSRLASKIITPYQSLNSLEDFPKRLKAYNPPQDLLKEFKDKESEYFKLKENI